MNHFGHRLISSFSLCSRIPVRLGSAPDFSSTAFLLPLFGLAAGTCAFIGYWVGIALFGTTHGGWLAAFLALASQYAGFNLFHLDGLMDTADAAGVQGNQEKRRAVLKDSRIGVYAFFAGFCVLAARLMLLERMLGAPTLQVCATLLLAPVAGRLAGCLTAAGAEPAPGSTLAAMVGRLSPRHAAAGFSLGAIPAFILTALLEGILPALGLLLAGALCAALIGLLVGYWYKRKIGGHTGDAIGAAIELGELAVLLTLASVWR